LMGGFFLHRATYVDGEMIPAQKGASADPKPCAGNDGTTITVRRVEPSPPIICLMADACVMCPLGREPVLQLASASFSAPKFI
jgi:hypothetical protein